MEADQNRAKDFLLVDSHVLGDVVDDSGSNEVALRILGVNIACSVKNELGSFLLSSAHQFQNSLLKFLVANGTEIDAFLVSCADLEALGLGDEILDPLLGLSHEDGSGKSHASLS